MKAARRLVLDASVAVAWCFDEEATTTTETALDLLYAGAELVVPPLWPFEVANALLSAERRKRISVAELTALIDRISSFPISIEPIDSTLAFGPVLARARQHGLTAYDAAYLELALRRTLPLATLDNELRDAARLVGITLV
jgi:predicted nucleic acid-binding protein